MAEVAQSAKSALKKGFTFFKAKADQVKDAVILKAEELKVSEKASQFGENAKNAAKSAAEYTKESSSAIMEGYERGTLGRQAGDKAARAGAFFNGLS